MWPGKVVPDESRCYISIFDSLVFFINFFKFSFAEFFPRLVPEISPLDAFCDGRGGVVGIGDSRSWIPGNLF